MPPPRGGAEERWSLTPAPGSLRSWQGSLPEMVLTSTPSSRASLRVAGVARTRPEEAGAAARGGAEAAPPFPDGADTVAGGAGFGAGGAGLGGGGGGAAAAPFDSEPSSSISTSRAPTGTVSPSLKWSFLTLPFQGEGTSTVALSVMISRRGWSDSTSCPSLTSQLTSSPSTTPSARSGSLNCCVICLFPCRFSFPLLCPEAPVLPLRSAPCPGRP
jgi:hypothetical protein